MLLSLWLGTQTLVKEAWRIRIYVSKKTLVKIIDLIIFRALLGYFLQKQ